MKDPQFQATLEAIKLAPCRHRRKMIAVAGPPASGKSTLAARLAQNIPDACIVPMDGFHRSNDDLMRHDLLTRKGAPDTFDVDGFINTVRACQTKDDVPFPTFDRAVDGVVDDGGRVGPLHQMVIVEGNYLLSNTPPWSDLIALWDFSIMIDQPMFILRQRLIKRWLDHGHTLQDATNRAEGNDIKNANFVKTFSADADLILRGE